MRDFSCHAKQPGEAALQRTFSKFPSGLPGSGLFLLRTTIGCAFVAQGVGYLAAWHDLKTASGAVCLVEVASGVLLVTGYFTPFAAVGAALSCVVTSLALVQSPAPNFFEARSDAALTMTIAVAIVCLGPGAFSIDSRRFGRREIIISEAASERRT